MTTTKYRRNVTFYTDHTVSFLLPLGSRFCAAFLRLPRIVKPNQGVPIPKIAFRAPQQYLLLPPRVDRKGT